MQEETRIPVSEYLTAGDGCVRLVGVNMVTWSVSKGDLLAPRVMRTGPDTQTLPLLKQRMSGGGEGI